MSSHPRDNIRQVLSILTTLIILGIYIVACAVPDNTQQTSTTDNQPPVIRYLTAQDMTTQKQVAPSAPLEIQCVATDDDDDSLNYQWSVTGGKLEGEGDRIMWTAPDTTGEQTITVEITDGKGGQDIGSIVIMVTHDPPQYPVVTSVTCIGCVNGIEASRWKTYEIRCEASDPDGDTLDYTWFATTGKIDGYGPTATWITVGQYGNALITVIIRDEDGNETEGYLAVNISCCH